MFCCCYRFNSFLKSQVSQDKVTMNTTNTQEAQEKHWHTHTYSPIHKTRCRNNKNFISSEHLSLLSSYMCIFYTSFTKTSGFACINRVVVCRILGVKPIAGQENLTKNSQITMDYIEVTSYHVEFVGKNFLICLKLVCLVNILCSHHIIKLYFPTLRPFLFILAFFFPQKTS